jgi:stage II sporulation protein M
MVQGERMKKKLGLYKKGNLPVYGLFLIGFLAGVILPNLAWKYDWSQKTAASIYLLTSFADKNLEKQKYMLHVLRLRGSQFLIPAFCGLSVFGITFSVVEIVLIGFQTGFLMTASILQFGLQGGIIGIGAMFPQYILYFPCYFYLMKMVYEQSAEIWKNHGLFPTEISRYFVKILLCGVLYAGGIVLEIWCNPPVMEILMKSLNIFGTADIS